MMYALLVVLALAYCNSILIERVYQALPEVELRRRARQDKKYAALYRMMAYGPTLQLLVWLKGSLSAVALIVWAAHTSWWLAGITGLLISLVALGAYGRTASAWQIRYASLVAPVGARGLSWLQPIFGRLARAVAGHSRSHTGLYEREDLLELLKQQARQPDSRLNQAELKIVSHALSFGGKTVASAMVLRAKSKMVAAGDAISPMVMDELHKTGQTRFLVVKEVTKSSVPEVVGTLYIKDLLENLEQKGHIRDIMRPHPGYINESQTLRDALAAFLKTHQHLLVVVNNFEEVSGTLSIEDVLQQVLGEKFADEFEGYDNPAAVAKAKPEKQRSQQDAPEVE